MKKRNLIVSTLVAAAALLAACTSADSNEPNVTKRLPIDKAYTELVVSHAFRVEVCDTVSCAVVTIPESQQPYLRFETSGGTLSIGYTRNWLAANTTGGHVLLPPNAALNSIELSGASSFSGDIEANDVEVELSGASVFVGAVKCSEIDMDLSGASTATVSGLCSDNMDVELSGASELSAAEFNASRVDATLSGASTANITLCSSLDADLSGASQLVYHLASPDCKPEVDTEATGGSTVTQR
ncbi:MAG: DUF2807 domain-containing protein [Bacteroidales bacterium]|nr:DUF2807 domain-containing protein [Bacteroidales bacterium]